MGEEGEKGLSWETSVRSAKRRNVEARRGGGEGQGDGGAQLIVKENLKSCEWPSKWVKVSGLS